MPKVKNTKHKVQITSLPEGFELIDGNLVKKAHGGKVTGDQHNYGLATVNPHPDQSSAPTDTDVRYSLSSVPRDQANIEAEGGETVLTDLSNDGQFGLYDIKGPRHSSGGVPMFLPEQSFIFSDTKKMKMGKELMKDHGIDSKKKMTPAKISKKYELNKYYGLLNDQYVDNIQATTAELMLDKNKEGLSKLAFGQEMMKNFEEGVPMAAFPYLDSIGIDPVEFAARVDALKQQEQQAQQQPPMPPQPMPGQEPQFAQIFGMQPQAKYGAFLDQAQYGNGFDPYYGYDNPYMPQNLNQFYSDDSSFRRPIQSAYMPMDLGTRGNVLGALNNLVEGADRMFSKKDRDGDGLADGVFMDRKAKRNLHKLKKAASYNYEIQVDPNDPRYHADPSGDLSKQTTDYGGNALDLYNASRKGKKHVPLGTKEDAFRRDIGSMDDPMLKYNPKTMRYDVGITPPKEYQSKYEELRPDLTKQGYKSFSQLQKDLSGFSDDQRKNTQYLGESLTDYQKELKAGNLPKGTQFGMDASGAIGYYDPGATLPEGSDERIRKMMMGEMAYGGGLPRAQFAQEVGPGSCGDGTVWDFIQQKCVPTASDLTTDPGQLTADLIENQSNQENLANILGKDINKPTPTPTYNDPTVTRKKGNLATRLNRGIDNFMTSPFAQEFGEGSMFAAGMADVINQMALNKKGNQADQDMLKYNMADNYMGVDYDPIMAQGIWDDNTGLINKNMEGDPSVGGGYAGYYSGGRGKYGKELPMAQDGKFTPGSQLQGGSKDWLEYYYSDSPEAKQYRDERYAAYLNRLNMDEYKKQAKKHKFSTTPLSAEDYHDLYGRAQKQIYAIQDFYKDQPDYLQRGTWDKTRDWDTSKYKTYDEAKAAGDPMLKKMAKNWMYNKAIADINAAHAGEADWTDLTPMTDDEIANFQAGYVGGQMLKAADPDIVNDMRQKGLDDQIVTIDGVDYIISPEDTYFGNTTVGQSELYTIPGEPPPKETPCDACKDGSVPQKDADGNCLPCPEIEAPEVPDVAVEGMPPIKEPWIQDVLKTRAIADRRRRLGLPWQPATQRRYMDVILEDPTRAIAARNSQLASAQEAMGAFGGKNQLMANLAAAQGQAADDIANVVAGVNARNVGTVNQANQVNAGLAQQFDQLETARATKLYDDTNLALEQFLNEQNFDREQYADAMANLITNMSDTYNYNQLYDLFNIRPLRGGDVEQVGSKAFQPTSQADEWAFMDDYMEAAKRAKAAGLVDKDGNVDPNVVNAIIAQKQGRVGYTDPREAAWKDQYRSYLGGYRSKKGGEPKMKKWAVPFYTGKMGI